MYTHEYRAFWPNANASRCSGGSRSKPRDRGNLFCRANLARIGSPCFVSAYFRTIFSSVRRAKEGRHGEREKEGSSLPPCRRPLRSLPFAATFLRLCRVPRSPLGNARARLCGTGGNGPAFNVNRHARAARVGVRGMLRGARGPQGSAGRRGGGTEGARRAARRGGDVGDEETYICMGKCVPTPASSSPPPTLFLRERALSLCRFLPPTLAASFSSALFLPSSHISFTGYYHHPVRRPVDSLFRSPAPSLSRYPPVRSPPLPLSSRAFSLHPRLYYYYSSSLSHSL